MPSNIAYNMRRMPRTSQFNRMVRAPEHLYYHLLFSMDPKYAKSREAWTGWLEMGFSATLREGPASAARVDRIKVSVHHSPRRTELLLEGGNTGALARLEAVLKTVDGHRRQTAGKDEAGRAKLLAAEKDVESQLIAPVIGAMKGAGLSASEMEAFLLPLDQALAALTDPDMTSLEVGAGVKVGV